MDSGWTIVWVILGFLMLIAGYLSGNIVTMVVDLAVAFGNSSFLEANFEQKLEIILVNNC